MALRKSLIVHLFALASCFAQPDIKYSAKTIWENAKPYLVLDLTYCNRSQDTLVTYVQNWRAIKVEDSSKFIPGYPFVPRLTNRFFFVPTGVNLRSRIGRIEDNFLGKIVANSFVIMRPRDSLRFIVVFDDSVLAMQFDEKKVDLYFLMNWTTYCLFQSAVPDTLVDVICSHADEILVPSLPIDSGEKWNTVMLRDFSSSREISTTKLADEGELLIKLTKIFRTFMKQISHQ